MCTYSRSLSRSSSARPAAIATSATDNFLISSGVGSLIVVESTAVVLRLYDYIILTAKIYHWLIDKGINCNVDSQSKCAGVPKLGKSVYPKRGQPRDHT